MNCQSSYIIYLVTCQKYSGQYVGKSTQAFTRRHFGHKQKVKNRIGGLGQHYGGQQGCGYDSLRVMIIEKVEDGNPGQLTKREIYWQNQLSFFLKMAVKPSVKERKKWFSFWFKWRIFHLGSEKLTYFSLISCITIVDNDKWTL